VTVLDSAALSDHPDQRSLANVGGGSGTACRNFTPPGSSWDFSVGNRSSGPPSLGGIPWPC